MDSFYIKAVPSKLLLASTGNIKNKKLISLFDSNMEKLNTLLSDYSYNDRSRKYWSDLKAKLKKEGSEQSEKVGQLKMEAEDGKFRLTDVADTEQLFRLTQTIPCKRRSVAAFQLKFSLIIFLHERSSIIDQSCDG